MQSHCMILSTTINYNAPFGMQTWQSMIVKKRVETMINYHSHFLMGLNNKQPLIIIILTKVNTFGKTCWETSHALNINDMRYENSIPAGMYRRAAITKQPIAGGGDSEGSWKAGISINISITGIKTTMPSEMRSSSQYTKDDTPDTLSKWRIFICKTEVTFIYKHCRCHN